MTTAENVYSEYTALAQATGSINLGQGFPDDSPPQALLEAAQKYIGSGHNHYPPSRGVLELREAVAEHQHRHWGLELDAGRGVVVTTGACEAITATVLALLSPGDEAVIFEPAYDLYAAAIALAKGVVRRVPPTVDGSLDLETLRDLVGPRTRLIMLNSPGNPSGRVYSDEELEGVAEVALRHALVVVSDEVYEHIVFDGRQHRSIMSLPGMAERTVAASSAAKTFSVTGWKIGWATGPPALLDRVHDVKQYLSFASGTPFQPAVAEALLAPQIFFDDLVRSFADRRTVMVVGLRRAGFEVPVPEGGYFVLADASPFGVRDAAGLEQFCRELPQRAGVVGIPGSNFSEASDMHLMRFCFAKSRALINEAVDRLVHAQLDQPQRSCVIDGRP